MPTLSIEEAETRLARVAEQAAAVSGVRDTEERRRAAQERVRIANEELHAAEAELKRLLRLTGAVIRRLDEIIERTPPSSAKGKALLAEARSLRAEYFAVIQQFAPEEAWFWTEEWQAGEREADEAIEAGALIHFANDEEFDAALDELDAAAG